jgi:TetR/AcrR family transcriptional regulator, transcriptional repressor for nem operon
MLTFAFLLFVAMWVMSGTSLHERATNNMVPILGRSVKKLYPGRMARTGRPREFDEADVVRGAMEVFWQRGYAGTSLRELGDRLGVLPGSLHSALGSKHGLFLRALEDYVNDTCDAATALRHAGSPLSAIRMLLESVLQGATETPGRGCMLGNTATELLPHDDAARQVVQCGLRALEEGFEQALQEAQRIGEGRADLCPTTQARVLVALTQGLHITARAEPDPHRFDGVIDSVVDSMARPGDQAE